MASLNWLFSGNFSGETYGYVNFCRYANFCIILVIIIMSKSLMGYVKRFGGGGLCRKKPAQKLLRLAFDMRNTTF